MKSWMPEQLGECGFDWVRFAAGSNPENGSGTLGGVLPLLIRLEGKRERMVHTLSNEQIEAICSACAGTPVQVGWGETPDGDTVDLLLSEPRLTLARGRACGLRDLIFAATLIRSYREVEPLPSYRLSELIEATWVRLMEELPQVLTYSTAARTSLPSAILPIQRDPRHADELHVRAA